MNSHLLGSPIGHCLAFWLRMQQVILRTPHLSRAGRKYNRATKLSRDLVARNACFQPAGTPEIVVLGSEVMVSVSSDCPKWQTVAVDDLCGARSQRSPVMTRH